MLSRLISVMVSNGNISLISASRNNHVPSHIMYTNDILIFCSAKTSNVNNLIAILKE